MVMRKLRYCKRYSEVFEAPGKCSRICSKCTKSYHTNNTRSKYSIQNIIGNKKWAYGLYDKEKG